MARGHSASFDDDVTWQASQPGLEATLSASWPIAGVPWRRRPEPPKAPLRKPSDAGWEVPFLKLPNAPETRRAQTDSTGARSAGTPPTSDEGFEACLQDGAEDAQAREEGEEDDEPCVFALDGAAQDAMPCDDDAHVPRLHFQLIGLDDLEEHDESIKGKPASHSARGPGCGSWQGEGALGAGRAGHARSRSGSSTPPLGASPMLLSALEHLAMEVDTSGRLPEEAA